MIHKSSFTLRTSTYTLCNNNFPLTVYFTSWDIFDTLNTGKMDEITII